ncbi:NAD(P)-dependent oxidoreductase [Nocardia cyriacigeorgica]|uniref:NAD-dependent epimerase/dehydratase family protein n=1 Tax=Nocardia cyriacigeorgica TaxID=135487 RepID=UPI0018937714|nr:NAD(P)-dependent oxidoreductase [Nocardia cyriacigeorgica]MBF6097222.1 NAD(P)-dependent oxidoreductase [Nocardia cyriacigeorgica]MBF6160800.1 NAD(P)-dependent oxidoreductase [Nocardia cyriacigeorgica]MBF6201616.1 NAD(P)-dependent oxidoreductase [Nocardia cyriacigeorgica]MBF6395458.1 NAD(P)-dependent oxidoreductase [Nocardia cyriacigeorgica]MBF6401090.1 NAD(P)-dependent oxidoreductase [Nocardia cyriacigeorgica]
MNHVVVIGGTGFLGSHLCRALLERGDRVTAIDPMGAERAAFRDFGAHPRFAFRCADITGPGAFSGLGPITHIAHFVHGGSASRTPGEMIRAARSGTMAAMEQAVARGVRIVIVSGAPGRGRTGRRPAVGVNDLEGVRGAAAHIAEMTARRYPEARVGIARAFEVYGPRLRPGAGVAATICAAALRDQTLYLVDDERSFVYVTDAVAAVVALLDAEIRGPIDIGGPTVTLSEFARTANALTGRGWVECTPLTRTASHRNDTDDGAFAQESTTRTPDLTRTFQLLGWLPTTSLHAGVHHTLDWMRTALRLGEPLLP